MDFSTFVISLASSAMHDLGEGGEGGEGPEGADREPDLVLAQQTIDILAMLERKTEGNLDADEQKLLGGVLYQIRLAFVEARSRVG